MDVRQYLKWFEESYGKECGELYRQNILEYMCIIRNGKGEKQRVVLLNSKVINAVRDYLKERDRCSMAINSEYLFVSKKRSRLNRTVVNRISQEFSDNITPHQLRHFFYTNAIEKGLSIHEVANQAGHW